MQNKQLQKQDKKEKVCQSKNFIIIERDQNTNSTQRESTHRRGCPEALGPEGVFQ
jgi:hypothetical protein